jgi:integrase
LRTWAQNLLSTVAPDTAARYVSHVSMMNARIFGEPTGPAAAHLADTRAMLARLHAGHVCRQAVPATRHDMRSIWRAAPADVRLMAALLWAGAFRHSDVVSLTPAAFRQVTDTEYDITLRVTKTTTYSGRPRVVRVALPPRVSRRLHQALQRRPFVLPTYSRFRREIGRICPHLTAHSFRRGAVQTAMDNGVSDDAVMRLTGHKSLESLSTYAARLPRTWAEQMTTASRACLW